MRANIGNRDFSDALQVSGVQYTVKRYSKSAIGGPLEATIEARGSELGLWTVLNKLRAPVFIGNDDGLLVWFGYVESVDLALPQFQIGLTVESMANRIRVAYTELTPGRASAGKRGTTTTLDDTLSISEYGIKEMLSSGTDLTPTAANELRARLLALYKLPQRRSLSLAASRSRTRTQEPVATITCRGWFTTLDWRYYSATEAGARYDPDKAATDDAGSALTQAQAFGRLSSDQKIAQSFVPIGTEASEAISLALRLRADGTPSGDCMLELCQDSAGAPGAALASVTIPLSEFTTYTHQWFTKTITNVTLQPATTYWIVLSKSGGGVDITNFYSALIDITSTYASGATYLYNGSAWSLREVNALPAGDLLFRVGGVVETTTQIQRIVTASGQFYTGTDILDASGVKTSPYRSGDLTAGTEIKQLLRKGTSNAKRLLATTTPNRRLQVFEEPDQGTADYAFVASGQHAGDLRDPFGTVVDLSTCPVGVWVTVQGLFPESSALAGSGTFFVDEATYAVDDGTWTPKPRGQQNPYEAMQLESNR